MITHCPKDDLLLSYSAGALGESWSLAVGSHVQMSKEASDNVALGEKIGGSLLSDLAPVSLEKSFDAVLDRRVSITQTFVPFSFASMMRCACGLK